jgi:transcriptional regulator with XRE-family HTH domain
MEQARTFETILGETVRERRQDLGLTQDTVARRCSMYFGLPFNRAVVDSIERGVRELTLPELAVVLAVLEMSLDDLRDTGPVALSGFVAVKADTIVDQILGTEPVWRFATSSPKTGRLVWRDALSGYVSEPGVAEQKAARKLDLTPEELDSVARDLWGRSLTDERDVRVNEQAAPDAEARTLQALRGHVTRELLQELESVLDQA